MIVLTILILIIGLQHFKNLSGFEKQILIISFCIVISGVLFFLQVLNIVDSSSFTVTLTDTSNDKPFSVNANVNLLRINHSASVQFPLNDEHIRILSADSEGFNEKLDIFFYENFYSVKTHGQVDLYVAKLDVSESERHFAVYESDESIVAANLGDSTLQKLVYVNDFNGSMPVSIKKYSNLTLDADSIPYRNLFFDYFEQTNQQQTQFANFCKSIIRKNRQFVACYNSTSSKNLHILLSPMINQKN